MFKIIYSIRKIASRLVLFGVLFFLTDSVYSADVPVMPQIQNEPEPFVYPEIEDQITPAEKPVIDDPSAPRMLLKGFEIYGVNDYPEHDITLEKIQQLIAVETAAMIHEGNQRLFTMGMYERIANAITRYYRERGFFLARAYIPEQKVSDGIVKLKVAESSLEQIAFDDNQLYDDETMGVLFEDLIDKPVHITGVESALYKLNDYPGLTASAIFGPGSKPGSAAIVMRTEETSSINFLSFDNYGSAFTGENRVLFRHVNNNVFGNADSLMFNVMGGLSPTNSQYADVFYVQPVYKSLFKVGGGAKVNFFSVGEELEDLDINGESIVINGFIDYNLVHTRLDRFSLMADLSLKSATSKLVDEVSSEDKLSVIRFDMAYSGVDRWLWRANHEFLASISIGMAGFLGSMDENGNDLSSRTGETQGNAGGDFTKFNLSYTRLQPIVNLQSLLFRFQAQFSSDLLTSLEQYSLGGPYNVRAYPVAEILVDNAIFTSFEYILNASPEIELDWLSTLQLSLYFDYAKGDLNDPLINEVATAALSGLGVGIQIEPFNNFIARIDFSTALGDEPSDLQSLPFYFSMKYRF
ncbi:MAG: ShlB/FhaC/HecB family hemolysin secretion/activation protein [Gammaproteobacteria bacterium]|nr:ShlB/FhaC/HecB family hemolysin secretion/activation protein [Gammaproteobacteria bacterium]